MYQTKTIIKSSIIRLTGSALMLASIFAMAGCAPATLATSIPAPIPIEVSHPVQREVTNFLDFTGRTEAVELVEVRARVGGFLDKVNFKDGALVNKGDLLFVIDQRPYLAELNRAEAQLEQAKAGVTESAAKAAEAQAQIQKSEASLALAKQRYERSQELVGRNAVSKDEFELHHSELLQAKATLEGTKAQLGSSEAAIATAQAAVPAAETAVEIAKLNLEYTRIIAPITGRISRTLITQGNLVQAAPQGTAAPLTTIVSMDPIYVYFDVDEPTVLRVRQLIREGKAKSAREVELPLSLGLGNEAGYPHHGMVNFVDNQINPKVGTLRVRGVVPNKDEALSPGLFVRVRVPIGFPHPALLITDRAIDTDQGQKIVYVVDQDNKVVIRPIRVGSLHDGLRAVEDGLKPGDRVVVTGLQQVRPGMVVEPKIVEMPRSGVPNQG
jgi:RND family efflux transporter MFP subunit